MLGTAVGDSIGLPREGLSRERAQRLFGALRHQLVFGRGMLSDDTEHTCMLIQALLASGGDLDRFARSFSWRLRLWLLGLPAGVGLATVRATLRLWLGWPAHKSGVRSAGNGAAMRAAPLGLVAEESQLRQLVELSSRVTHTDHRAIDGAYCVALATRYAVDGSDTDRFVTAACEAVRDDDLRSSLHAMSIALEQGRTVEEFADARGWTRGVSGYVNHTVPASLYAWLRHRGDFARAIESIILLGGDTDTTGAITGAIAGAECGADAIPRAWLDGLADWPRSVAWLTVLGGRLGALATGEAARPLPLAWPAIPLRNAMFLAIVLGHGLRRALPPYARGG